MRYVLIGIASAALTACATSGTQMQAECESRHNLFSEIFQCTYEAVASRNPSILQDARAKLYLLRGEQLAIQTLEGKVSSLDAKVSWQQLYVQLKSARDQEIMAIMNATSRSLEASRATAPQITNPARSVNCTSTKLGSTAYTTCQ